MKVNRIEIQGERGSQDAWEPVIGPYMARAIDPVKFKFTYFRDGGAWAEFEGPVMKKDGTPGQNRGSARLLGSQEKPAWVVWALEELRPTQYIDKPNKQEDHDA